MKTYGILWTSTNTHKNTFNKGDTSEDDVEDDEEDRGDRHGDGWGEKEGEEGVALSRIASAALKDIAKNKFASGLLTYAEIELKKPFNSFAEVI